jgi:hypothetical protein
LNEKYWKVEMIKTFALLRKRPDLRDEEFHEHWSTIHREHALEITSIRRYVQFHVDESAAVPGFAAAGLNGVPENWWDGLAVATSLRDNPEYTEHAGPDEANFIDVAAKGRVITSERVRTSAADFERSQPAVKAMLFLGAGAEPTNEVGDWIEGAWSAAVATVPGLVRHVDAVAVSGSGAPRSDYAVVTELWWRQPDDYHQAAPMLSALAGTVSAGPLDPARCAGHVGQELRVIWPER